MGYILYVNRKKLGKKRKQEINLLFHDAQFFSQTEKRGKTYAKFVPHNGVEN